MKLTITLVVCLAVSLPLVAQDKARLKAISDTFSKIEENHEIWSNYSTVVQNAAPVMTTIHHLWISDGEGEEKLSKLETHSLEDHGESKQQFYFKGDQLIFTLDRTENVLIDPNVTDVTEKRYYFADGQLIRVLNKQGRFPAGQPTETDALKSQAVPLSEIENASETYTLQHEMTAPVIQKLLRLAEDGAPSSEPAPSASAGPVLTGDGWRTIAGSGSRDGIYALAWGQKGQSSPQGNSDEEGFMMGDQEDANLINYAVNVRTKQIVGTLVGKHFGDKSTYNHDSTETAWSSSSLFLAQVNSGKWATFDANVYGLLYTSDGGNALSKAADLLEPTKKAIFEHLEGGPVLKKFDKGDFAITLHDPRIVYQGGDCVVQVGVIGQIPKSEEEDASFEATVTFTLATNEESSAPLLSWRSTEGH
jgi:hypothetical protein